MQQDDGSGNRPVDADIHQHHNGFENRLLADRYGDVDGVNHAWGTAFWSQRYSSLEEVLPPRITPDGAWANPTQQLDYRRFASDLLLEEFVSERDLLHRLSPGVPVTTNFMVMTRFNQLDYWAWAREMDVVSNDYYPDFADPLTHVEAAMSADVVRGLADGGPWLQAGRHGDMDWIEETPGRRADPRVLWPQVKSVVMLLVASVIVVNFLVDMAYAVVDPRLRRRR